MFQCHIVTRKLYIMSHSNSSSKRPSIKQSRSPKQGKKPVWEFVDVRLTEQDKAILRDGWRPRDTMEDYITILCENGFKVSISMDFEHDSAIFAVSGKHKDSKNVGRTLTARGSTVQNAWLSWAYKFEFYCDDGVFPQSNEDWQEDFS